MPVLHNQRPRTCPDGNIRSSALQQSSFATYVPAHLVISVLIINVFLVVVQMLLKLVFVGVLVFVGRNVLGSML